MAGNIFVSYRREDTAGFAGRLFDRLVASLPSVQIFMDVDSIEFGLDFVDVINDRVGACDAVLALIGSDWNRVTDPEGRRRFDDPGDFVRLEIEAALRRDVRIMPILINGAQMPRSEELPESIRKIVRRQALEVSHTRFRADADRLVNALRHALRPETAAPSPTIARYTAFSNGIGDDAPSRGGQTRSIAEYVAEQSRFFREGRFSEGLRSAREARTIHGESPYFWSHEGICLSDLGRQSEALECFDRGLKLAPNWVQLWTNKGRTLRSMQRNAEALVCYEKAIECDPEEAIPWDNKGNCLLDLFRLDEAKKCFEQVLLIDPLNTDARRKLELLTRG